MKVMKVPMVIWGGADKMRPSRIEPNSMLESYYNTPLPPPHSPLSLSVCVVVVFVSDREREETLN